MTVKETIQADIDSLPADHKTADIDRLINRYVREKLDVSPLRDHVLAEQQFHRIYYYVSLKQIKSADDRLVWIDKNKLFSDWWHTDQLINFVSDADFALAFDYAKRYVNDADPFIRRWGCVMFISKLCRDKTALEPILSLLHDDSHYYVQMGEAWLIAELAIFFPDDMLDYIAGCGLKYNIIGKAIQKICDSYRISDEYKEKFKSLREARKNVK